MAKKFEKEKHTSMIPRHNTCIMSSCGMNQYYIGLVENWYHGQYQYYEPCFWVHICSLSLLAD